MDATSNTVGEDYASSVGSAFRDKQIYTLQHPAYVSFSQDVTEELTRIAERAAAQRSTARKLLITISLDPDEAAGLAALYPEFTPVYVPMNRPVHSFFTACRGAANEWCATITERYAEKYVHYGGSLLHTLLRRGRQVHLETSLADEVMAHQRHSDAVDVHRIFGDYAAVQSNYGLVVPRQEYDEYLRGRQYNCCSESGRCTVAAEAMCVDATVNAVSPVQVALGMQQHGAEMSHGFFLYHPSMLVQDSGELPGTGIRFEKTERAISFLYPEGSAGVSSYSRATYSKWLASHCFSVGERKAWYQMELLKHRGCFMFFRIVKVDAPGRGEVTFRHALDLPDDDEYSLVESWKLKSGFRSDAVAGGELVRHDFLVRSRVLRRVREFAMQLNANNFTRHAIKKQIRVVNNRWVVNGSTVCVAAPLDPGEIESLTTAIYARAFVDRYESSQLSSEMMARLKQLTGFHSASFADRVKAVASAVVTTVLASTVGKADAWLRDVMDRMVGYFEGTPEDRKVGMVPGPTYVTMQSAVGGWRAWLAKYGEVLYRPGCPALSIPVVEDAVGGTLAVLMNKYGVTGRRRSRYPTGPEPELETVVRVATDVEDVRVAETANSAFVDAVASVNELDSATEQRYNLEYERVVRQSAEIVQNFMVADDPDPVYSLNQLYREVLPSVAMSRLEYDTFSLSLDPQDRTLEAPMLRMSTYFGLPPAPRSYYASNLVALNVPKRQNTAPELLTAIAARNLSAPVVALPQEEDVLIRSVWDAFLDDACVPDAREKLKLYQSDSVALAEDALSDWGSQAKPGVVDALVAELEKNSRALADMPVDEYLVMLKADVKPTLSTKPVGEVTAPQVIVYHEKPLSALYSSIFRVLVRRFLSLLKPNYHVNLLKNTDDIGQFVQGCHPFGAKDLSYLENDFGKYDKSQSRFVFKLEEFVFQQLGMNQEMLSKWVHGHVECSLRSVSVGLSLHVMYQRKSGDATTAFGNVILNVLSVNYAYRGTKVVWAVFMGDDSLVCAKGVVADGQAVQMLAEVFNLIAKFYITDAPYFASTFVVIDNERMTVSMCPDVIKRVERLSMHISGDDPQWEERYVSFQDSMAVFRDQNMVQKLAVALPVRYEASEGLVRGAVSALGTMVRDKKKFRLMWAATPEVVAG